jgi:hypothetical protein
MDQEGTLSIVQRGLTYQVRYASDNPYEHDRQPYTCPDEAHLASWLHHLSLEPWTIQQTFAELQRGRGVTVLRMTCSALEVARLFPPSEGRAVGRDSGPRL